ncbi:hypothetical protein C0J45_19933 [Silurus meridionalis]|nr:hypothetical protein C0J45_19933 [Silurus meridionalis]
MAAGESRWLQPNLRLFSGVCAFTDTCYEGYRFAFDTSRGPCEACDALAFDRQTHCLWCQSCDDCPLGDRCYDGPRDWFGFPPQRDEFAWETDEDQRRPVTAIMRHANMFSPEGMWLDSVQNSVYDLPGGLQLVTRVFTIRRAISLAESFGVLSFSTRARNTHSFLLTTSVMQRTTVTYYTITLGGYVLWITEPAKHRDWHCRPILVRKCRMRAIDSEVISMQGTRSRLKWYNAVWFAIRTGRRISAPLPHWIKRLSPVP